MSDKNLFSKHFQNNVQQPVKMRQNATFFLNNFQNPYPDISIMKVAVVLEARRPKNNGKCAIKIRFNFQNQAYYITTGIEVPKENFIQGKVLGIPHAVMMNQLIATTY